MHNCRSIETGFDFWKHHIFHHCFHLIGYSWHGNKHFFALFKPHAGSGSLFIAHQHGIFRHFGLLSVHFRDLFSKRIKKTFHIIKGFFTENKLGIKVFAKRLFGDVISGGAKTACQEDEVSSFFCFFECIEYVLMIIRYGSNLLHMDANTIQFFSNPCGVGINHLPDKNLVSYGNNLRLHAAKIAQKKFWQNICKFVWIDTKTKIMIMKNLSIIALSIFCFSLQSCAQFDFNKIKKQAGDAYSKKKGGSSKLSNDEVVRGLKEALEVGTNNSTAKTSKLDGFYKDPKIKLPFPPKAVKVKNTVEDLGMKPQVDKFVLTINRAAEEASKEAAPIFVNAIKGMSIGDGFNILKGEDNAATEYLKRKTTAQLKDKFKPVVKRAIDRVEVTKYWNPLITAYNKVPFTEKQDPDLENYITEKAIDGLFFLIAKEEMKIRKDPIARISDLLKKVFGSQ